LSTVHVHATIDKETAKITYTGDSDAQLTKGLVAMLVNGLSGHTYEEIERVKPEFINFAGIANSLTPGRNNGFLNMLRMMKVKAKALSEEVGKAKQAPTSSSSSSTSASSSNNNIGVGGGGPIADAVLAKLSMLQPSELVLDNESHKLAGHAGMNGQSRRESHFNLRIVASCFEGLSLVQRHKMIYSLLADQMQSGPGEHIHALSISARTPSEQG
jgi:stress-induced morphogen